MLKNGDQERKSDRIVIGYDCGDYFSQMSYCYLTEEEPETFSMVMGGEAYNIPTVLAKRTDVNQWEYGEEALELGKKEGNLIKNLVSKALEGIPVCVEDYEFPPEDLLALFMKRSLALLALTTKRTSIEGIVFTVDVLNQKMLDVLNHCVESLGLAEQTNVYFQTREESFFSYMIKQPQDLWDAQVIMLDSSKGYFRLMRLEMNRKTVPVVAFIETEEFPEISLACIPKNVASRDPFLARADLAMQTATEEVCEERRIGSAYLIGDIFTDGWSKETLRYLCKGKRVFQGTNLFSKGACYYAKERYAETPIGKQHVYLGNDKLKTNIGMRILREGKDSYFAVLNAGINWFEAKKSYDIILEDGKELIFILTPLTGTGKKEAKFLLDGYPYHERKITRMNIELDMTSENKLRIHVVDLGFGEISQSTGLEWIEEISVE
jgi:hypothetical protein